MAKREPERQRLIEEIEARLLEYRAQVERIQAEAAARPKPRPLPWLDEQFAHYAAAQEERRQRFLASITVDVELEHALAALKEPTADPGSSVRARLATLRQCADCGHGGPDYFARHVLPYLADRMKDGPAPKEMRLRGQRLDVSEAEEAFWQRQERFFEQQALWFFSPKQRRAAAATLQPPA